MYERRGTTERRWNDPATITIRVTPGTKARLDEMLIGRERMDSLIRRLIGHSRAYTSRDP